MKKQVWFATIFTLFILPIGGIAFALPSVTILNDNLEIEVMSTFLNPEDSWAPPPSQLHGTTINSNYDGSLFAFSSTDRGYLEAETNAAVAKSGIEFSGGSNGWGMTGWALVDDDTGLDFPVQNHTTALASTSWQTVFRVDGEGARVNFGSWWYGTSEPRSMASLFDLTLGEYVQSGELLDNHIYHFLGMSEQSRLDGISWGLDVDTGFHLNFFDAVLRVPEPSILFLLVTGFVLSIRKTRKITIS